MGGVLVSLLLLILSLVFSYHWFFKLLFGLMLIGTGWNAYKVLKTHKYLDTTINDMAFRGKYDKTKYMAQKGQYEASKGVPA